MFTVKTDAIRFLKAVQPNQMVEVIGRVVKAQVVKLDVKVEVWAEEMYNHNRFKALETTFTMAMLDENNKPLRIDYSQVPLLKEKQLVKPTAYTNYHTAFMDVPGKNGFSTKAE